MLISGVALASALAGAYAYHLLQGKLKKRPISIEVYV